MDASHTGNYLLLSFYSDFLFSSKEQFFTSEKLMLMQHGAEQFTLLFTREYMQLLNRIHVNAKSLFMQFSGAVYNQLQCQTPDFDPNGFIHC